MRAKKHFVLAAALAAVGCSGNDASGPAPSAPAAVARGLRTRFAATSPESVVLSDKLGSSLSGERSRCASGVLERGFQ